MGMTLNFISSIFKILEILIVIECLLSWIVQGRNNEIMNIIRLITAPILEPFRKLQYKFLGNLPVDISPFLALFALQFIERIIYGILL